MTLSVHYFFTDWIVTGVRGFKRGWRSLLGHFLTLYIGAMILVIYVVCSAVVPRDIDGVTQNSVTRIKKLVFSSIPGLHHLNTE